MDPRFVVGLCLIAAALSCGCATRGVFQPPAVSIDRTFDSPFEPVWRAALSAMAGYPLERTNAADGLIETEWMYDGTTMSIREVAPGPGTDAVYRMRIAVVSVTGGLTRVSIRTYHTTYVDESERGAPTDGPWDEGYSVGYTVYTSDTDDEQRIISAIADALAPAGR